MYRCQTCHLPLVVSSTLSNLSTAQQRMLVSEKSLKKEHKEKVEPYNSAGRMQIYEEALRQAADSEILKDKVLLSDFLEAEEEEQPMTPQQWHKVEETLIDKLAQLEVDYDKLDPQKVKSLVDLDIKPQTLQLENGVEHQLDSDDVVSRVNVLTKVFNILSFKYDIDYPICVECSKIMTKELQTKFDEAMKEKNGYLQFLNKLSKQQSPNVTKLEASLAGLEEIKTKYRDTLREIEELEATEESLRTEIDAIDKEIKQVNVKEIDLLAKKNLYELELMDLHHLNGGILNTLKEKQETHAKLKSSNVYSDVFNISYDGAFGTINDLRLGNSKTTKVSWMEINSALGQLVLLLAIIIKKLGLTIEEYKLVPMGSYSKIEKYDSHTGQKTVLDCYSQGSSALERLFAHSSLDQAMVGLLNVVKQMETQLRQKFDKSVSLPYQINVINNTIGNLNIKLNRKITDDEWTMACKFLVADVKYLLAFSSAQSG